MRLGKEKKGKVNNSKTRRLKPKYSSPDLVPGRVSSNLIESVYATTLSDLASKRLEQYADDLMKYEDQLRALKNETEAEIDADGSVKKNSEIPSPPQRPLFHSQHAVDEFVQMMADVSRHFSAQTNGWKIHANAAKFERLLDERYGIFRPFVTNHPEIEHFVRSVQRKYAMGYFSPFRQGKPPIPRTTSIILLFMMQRGNVRLDALFLTALFLLIGLQPWALVAIVVLIQYILAKRRNRAIGPMKKFIPSVEPYYRRANQSTATDEDEATKKLQVLLQPVGSVLEEKEEIDMTAFNTMILGSGPGALYCAALLSRAGRKVLVLSPTEDASGCLSFACNADPTVATKYQSVPFDVDASNVARLAKQQEILAPALCTSVDYQGGIRFAQIGSEADGFAFEILSIPGMGADGVNDEIPFVLKAAGGTTELMNDAATYLGDGWPGLEGDVGHSTSGAYLSACAVMNASAGDFFLSKILPDSINDIRSRTTYQESAIRYVAPFLDKCFPLNAHVRSLMAGIGMKGENLKPSATSMGSHVTNICAAVSGEGMYYPIGGPRALCHALASVVEQNGGLVKTGITVKDLIFESAEDRKTSHNTKDGKAVVDGPPRCVGVKLFDNRDVKFGKESFKENPVVVSTFGFVHTFIRLLPDDVRVNHNVPRGLPALTEQRPVFKVLIGLRGTAEELNVTGADLYRLPSASIAADEYEEGSIRLGVIGGSSNIEVDDQDVAAIDSAPLTGDIDSTTSNPNEGSIANQRAKRGKKSGKLVFEPGSSWMQISFPSAKDPTFQARHGNITTCVVTVEADDEFVVFFDTKPKVYTVRKEHVESNKERLRLIERVQSDLLRYYPQLEGKIEHLELHGPIFRGLSHTPERYAAKGIRADSPYPGLFMGGSDLTVGESFAGSIVAAWLASNAVMGYNAIDYLFLQKNITSDLERFIEPPVLEDANGDVAVPYTPPPEAAPAEGAEGDGLFHEAVEHS